MWGFTKVQQRAILFLLATFGVGCAILFYRKQQPPPPVSPVLAAQLATFARQLEQDRVKVDSVMLAPLTISPKQSTITRQRLALNTATAVELAALPGIGATMAQRIVAYREQNGKFHRLEDLTKVKGIGQRRLATLKKWLVVD